MISTRANSTYASSYAPFNRVANVQTGDYVLQLADAIKRIEMNKATAVALTVPPNSSVNWASLPSPPAIDILATGIGQVSIVQGAGVTVNATPGLKLTDQWAGATLIWRSTDVWVLVGRLSA